MIPNRRYLATGVGAKWFAVHITSISCQSPEDRLKEFNPSEVELVNGPVVYGEPVEGDSEEETLAKDLQDETTEETTTKILAILKGGEPMSKREIASRLVGAKLSSVAEARSDKISRLAFNRVDYLVDMLHGRGTLARWELWGNSAQARAGRVYYTSRPRDTAVVLV